MIRQLLYNNTCNRIIRSILKPFTPVLPERLKFPVTGIFNAKVPGVPSFRMDTNATSAVTKYVFWSNGNFEYHAVKIFCGLVKDSDVFFDIGANIGYYSLIASSLKPDITTYAFEPMPSAFEYLERNIVLNNFQNIHAVKLALSAEKGKASFFSVLNPKFKRMAQLTGDGSLNNHSANVSKIEFNVDVETLDNFVQQTLGSKKIDPIKLDTEGNEHRVFAGAAKVLSQHRPIIQCEILKGVIEKEIYSVLMNYDYKYFRATDKGLVPVKNFSDNSTKYMDYYLVPSEKIDLVRKYIC